MQLQYLGQAGILLQGHNARVLIDPYLSDFVVSGGYGDADKFIRNYPPPILPEDLPKIDAVFITHDHADHCDLITLRAIAKNNPACKFIGPPPVREHLAELALAHGQVLASVRDELDERLGIDFRAVPAAHYGLTKNQGTGEFDFVGYLVRMDNCVVYHSGDTILYDQMVNSILAPGWEIDVACLPVNGRDNQREEMGITGNLSAEEAGHLAMVIHAKTLIPLHNDLFSINSEDPERVRLALGKVQGLVVREMAPGEILHVK